MPYSAGSIFLPEINTKHTSVTLFGKYALTNRSGLRLEYIYDRWSTDDWAWQIYPFPVLIATAP